MVQLWAYGKANFSLVEFAMGSMFGDHFKPQEWSSVFDPMYTIWDSNKDEFVDTTPALRSFFEETLKRHRLFLPQPRAGKFLIFSDLIDTVNDETIWASSAKRSKPPGRGRSDSLRAMDLGVINLTMLVTAQDGVTTGSSTATHNEGSGILEARPSKQKRRRTDADRQDSTAAGPSRVSKRRRMVARHQSSRFFDLSALDADDDEEEEEEEGNLDEGDLATDGLAEAPDVLLGGRVSFASRLEDICRQYEGGPGTAGHDVPRNPPRHSRPDTAGHGGPSSPLRHSQPDVVSDPFTRVYKIDILIGIDTPTSLFHDLKSL